MNSNVFGPLVFAVALNNGVKPDLNLGFQLKARSSAPSSTGSVVLEASTNLVQWIPLATNAATVASWPMVDTSGSGQSQRFYRTRRQ